MPTAQSTSRSAGHDSGGSRAGADRVVALVDATEAAGVVAAITESPCLVGADDIPCDSAAERVDRADDRLAHRVTAAGTTVSGQVAVAAIAHAGLILALGLTDAVNTGVVRQAARTGHEPLAGDRHGVVVAVAARKILEEAATGAIARRDEHHVPAGREVGTGVSGRVAVAGATDVGRSACTRRPCTRLTHGEQTTT